MDNVSIDTGFDTLPYSYARYPALAHNTLMLGERHLWCTVIEQAFIDIGAIIPTHAPQGRRAKTSGSHTREYRRDSVKDISAAVN